MAEWRANKLTADAAPHTAPWCANARASGTISSQLRARQAAPLFDTGFVGRSGSAANERGGAAAGAGGGGLTLRVSESKTGYFLLWREPPILGQPKPYIRRK